MSAALKYVSGAPATAFPNQGYVAVNDNNLESNLALLLGEVRGELRGIRSDLIEVKDALADAGTSNQQLGEKMNQMDTRLEKLEGSVTVMGAVVTKQTLRIDKIEPWAVWLAAVGAGLVFVGGALWFGIMNYGTALVHWLSSMLPKP